MKEKIIALLQTGIKEDAMIALTLAYKMPIGEMKDTLVQYMEIKGDTYKEVLYITRNGYRYVTGNNKLFVYKDSGKVEGWIDVTPEI